MNKTELDKNKKKVKEGFIVRMLWWSVPTPIKFSSFSSACLCCLLIIFLIFSMFRKGNRGKRIRRY